MSIAGKISKFNRDRKWKIFNDTFFLSEKTRILDAGFTDIEYLPSDNYLEKNYPYPEQITALSVETAKHFGQKYPQIKIITYDGRIMPFSDKSFDICWSNAVLEHVGSEQKQIQFLRELTRVGRRVFLTTPNKYFPIEVHTRIPLLHYLPKKYFDLCLMFFGLDWAIGDYMHLLSQTQLKHLLKKAGINEYRITKNRLFGWTLDFIVVI